MLRSMNRVRLSDISWQITPLRARACPIKQAKLLKNNDFIIGHVSDRPMLIRLFIGPADVLFQQIEDMLLICALRDLHALPAGLGRKSRG